MTTYYCPSCWQEIPVETSCCPVCGYKMALDSALSFEDKLLRSLEHPVEENRLIAIRILGDLGSQSALTAFEKLIKSPEAGIYDLGEVLVALTKIQSPRSLELLLEACSHPFPIICRLAKKLLKKYQLE